MLSHTLSGVGPSAIAADDAVVGAWAAGCARRPASGLAVVGGWCEHAAHATRTTAIVREWGGSRACTTG